MNKADLIVGHNGDRFDIRMANAFFVHNGLKPPSPYRTFDTLKVARNKFRFNSNKLGDIAEYLGIGTKLETGGFKLWLGCLRNEPSAWRKMKRYNRQDVALLEKVYLKLRPWANHPSIFLKRKVCPLCGSNNTMRRGYDFLTGGKKRRRYSCNSCGRYIRGEVVKNE